MNAHDIASLRKKLGINQVELAQLIGVHPITISKWERGESAPSAYQHALLQEFGTAAKDKTVQSELKGVLVGAGVIIALALLLKHLTSKK
ncbi:putative transcriptional regulator [Ereboglobus sp. PH5-10]|uniref:helix-turn-helix domain-containing protein n=1 Tax=Ereboglobus sp. PH5-10 TaxID=2940629 RepID=UPI002405F30F|nr:helix-turn-helix domain-containing protein [Ereboglobus sp. PH5-10]MDF9828543.1 putative transcriptional regulator [Ereboglobus sp. PH5-10]